MPQANPRFPASTDEKSVQPRAPYDTRTFDFSNIVGLSDRALELHRSLYEGYVKETNALLPLLYPEESAADKSSPEDRLIRDGLVRRFAFERNGMVLHELFFDALRGKSEPISPNGAFFKAAAASYGDFERWRNDVRQLAQTRGVGWVLTGRSEKGGRLFNVWIDEHQHGLLGDWQPVLAFDLWEHAFLIDFKPSERLAYLDTLFDNIDWKVVDARLR